MTQLFALEPGIRLQNLGIDKGLSQSTINAIIQDSRGYMWFGTDDGLNRYDGHDIKIFKNDPDNLKSIKDNDVRCLIEDDSSRLWIGSGMSDLGFLDLTTNQFKYIQVNKGNTPLHVRDFALDGAGILYIAAWDGLHSINTRADTLVLVNHHEQFSKLRTLEIDNAGNLWIGTEEDGLLFKAKEDRYSSRVFSHSQLPQTRIYSLQAGRENDLYMGVNGGLVHYSVKDQVQTFYHIASGTDSAEVTSLTYDRNGILWVATTNAGLLALNESTGQLHYHNGEDGRNHSLSNSGVLSLYTDRQGLMWIGTRGFAVQYFDPETPFKYYGPLRNELGGLNDPSIRAIAGDSETLWVGGYAGLTRFDRDSGKVTHFGPYPKDRGLGNKNVYSLTLDKQKRLWVGTEGGGLYTQESGAKDFDLIQFDDGLSQEADHIYELLQLRNGDMLVGTGEGLFRIKAGADEYESTQVRLKGDNEKTLDGEDVLGLIQDQEGSIWVGTTANGIYRLSEDYGLLAHMTRDRRNKRSISSDRIKCLFESRTGQVWIGTNGGGLNLWDAEGLKFEHYDEHDGLPDNTIYGILEDEQGTLWMSTNNGLASFDPRSRKIQTFGVERGLQSSEFNTGAFYKTPQGEMFFGGIQGLNGFFPGDVGRSNRELSVSLTDLLVSNQPVSPGGRILPMAIDQLDRITLTHNEPIVTFEFSAMNFRDPLNTEYRYQLQGVTQDWIYTTSNNRQATFTNLSRGEHLFMIQARQTGSGEFGPTQELQVMVKPPPWFSWWAISIYILLASSVLIRIRQNEINKMNLEIELKQNRQSALKLNEMDAMKSRLIANVSHELRTPLTLLDGHIENLRRAVENDIPPNARQNLKAAKKSLTRVTALSDQLFELARFAAGKIKLQASRQDLVRTLESIVEEFKGQSGAGKRKLILNRDVEHLEVYLDTGKFEQVLFNLLSNAFKFSPQSSEVVIELQDDRRALERGVGSFAVVRVSNQGPGIPAGALANIFDRLYQIDSTESAEKGGAGIGLALVRELVELHGGSIQVRSETQGETCFEFTIPKGHEHLSPDEIIDAPEKQTPEAVLDPDHNLADPTQSKILVVEDDPELRNFVVEGLSEVYTVFWAENGIEALEKARKELPDLILSDVNMPGKDGIQLLKDVRDDHVLSHVPVILLTGQTSPQDRVKGYEALANDYIGKPFKMEELRVRIESLFRSRQQLIHKLKDEGLQTLVNESTLSREDDRLFVKLKDLIESRLNRSSLTVEELAGEVYMSKRQLERKIKDITGQSPAELIRQTRLVTARRYLLEGTYATVAEISNAVGFRNVKYFSRLFRNQYGESPSDILKH